MIIIYKSWLFLFLIGIIKWNYLQYPPPLSRSSHPNPLPNSDKTALQISPNLSLCPNVLFLFLNLRQYAMMLLFYWKCYLFHYWIQKNLWVISKCHLDNGKFKVAFEETRSIHFVFCIISPFNSFSFFLCSLSTAVTHLYLYFEKSIPFPVAGYVSIDR